MNVKTRVGFLAGAAAISLTGVSVADSSAEALSTDARIAELEAQVAQLRGEGWLNEQRTEEVRSLIQDVLADADTRSSLLQSGTTAGYDKGFMLSSADGNFLLKINGYMQIRAVVNYQDDDNAANDSTRSGFENRRTRLKFSGHVVDPSWKYVIYGDFGTSGSFGLLDAYVQKNYDNGWFSRVGQFKGGWLREELVSAFKQLTVERSLVNGRFTQGRSQGIAMGYSGDQFRGSFMYSNGLNDRNGSALDEDSEYSFMGRMEFLAAGNWKQFGDFTSMRGSEYGAMIGVAAYVENPEFGTASDDDQVQSYGLTADVSSEGDGWNVYGAFIFNGVSDDRAGMKDRDQWAFVVQGGYFFTDDIEAFARFEYGDLDDDSEELQVLTVGFNKYWAGHGLKWTTDVGYGINEVSSAWASDGAGWRTDGLDEDGQFVIRSQIQLTF